MNRLALTTAALVALLLGADSTSANDTRARSATQFAVAGALYTPGVHVYEEVRHHGPRYDAHRYYSNYPRMDRHGYHHGRGAVVVQPHAWGHPAVVVPHRVYPPVYRNYYYGRPYYYGRSHSAFQYSGRNFSFGFSF